MPWLAGAAFEARTPLAELMPRLRETALEARFPSPNPDHDRGERRWKRAFSPSEETKKEYMAGGNHARSAGSRRRYYAVRVVPRRRRSPWPLDRGNLCCVIGQASNRTRASSEIIRRCPPAVLLTVPDRLRAVDCRYGMCHAGAREYLRPGCGRPQSAFEEQERGQKRRVNAGYQYRDPTCMCCRCDSLPGPDPGGYLAIDLKGGDDFYFCPADDAIM